MTSAETAAELLDQLIVQGLAETVQDLGKIRQLITILFQACILQPLLEPSTPLTAERARHTLSILRRHSREQPDILVSDSPLYKYLLPRIIYASERHAEVDNNLSELLIGAGHDLLRALSRLEGQRAATSVKALRAFAEAALVSERVTLYGYTDLKPSLDTAVIAARIAISPHLPFLDSTGRSLTRLLSRAAAQATKATTQRSLIRAVRHVGTSIELEPLLAIAREWSLDPETKALLEPAASPRKRKREASEDPFHKRPAIAEIPRILCSYCECNEKHFQRDLSPTIFNIWLDLPDPPLKLLVSILSHSTHVHAAGKIRNVVLPYLTDEERTSRLLAGHATAKLPPSPRAIAALRSALAGKWPIRSTSIATCGIIAKTNDDLLGDILELLFLQLGTAHPPTVALAYSELLSIASYREKTPYTLISPYLERISILLASKILDNKLLVGGAMQFLGTTRQNFFETTLRFTIPAMIVRRQRKVLDEIAGIVKTNLGMMILEHTATALSQIFLLADGHQQSLAFLVETLRNQANTQVTAQSLMTSCIVAFVVTLIIELGDEQGHDAALAALHRADQLNNPPRPLGEFLKPLMLGIVSHLNDALHDLQGKKTVEYKRKIIRSLGKLIETVGDSMSAFSPQIVASLQGTLGIAELRTDTLSTWKIFIRKLRYVDSGPFIGRTSAALVANWADFSNDDKQQAIDMITEIADNAQQLLPYLDEVVDMSHIPELASASDKLTKQRHSWPVNQQIDRMLDRINSKNPAVSITAMVEMRKLLPLDTLTQGDIFDPLASRIVHGLLQAVVDGPDELKSVGYECLGLVGALDPDRLPKLPEPTSILLLSNFAEEEESASFAIHLIRNLLVDAFRATNDTKHQNHLAYAIQQLLKFCGLTTRLITSSTTSVVKARWNRFPKDQHETLAPLLESRFTLTESFTRQYPHPIYENAATYREWIQMWTSDLLGRGTPESQAIFGVMRPVLRNQDVTVAHHILPHLVLHVLLSGDRTAQSDISIEINTVLHDQVNHSGSTDKRMLSAQVVFELMDHLSKYLRAARKLARNCKTVEAVLSSVETELLANAALQSKAYARSLRNFEQRIADLRKENRQISELQTYYERLHEIYADLDEPDGMEGVSTFVISPSLEHQIREHESTGRWTSAQSCWEVRLQQSPQDLSLHEGLLRCLRNLGHYDTLRTHIRGILSRHPDWAGNFASFEAEAAWIIGDWDTVKTIADSGHPMAGVMASLHEKNLNLHEARLNIGRQITSTQYTRAYEPVLQLHILRELEEIEAASKSIERSKRPQKVRRELRRCLDERFEYTATAFRTRETILSARRTAFSVLKAPILQPEIGKAWVSSSKMARKAGYDQTAYSAVLQAREVDASFAFVQQAKLSRRGGALKALTELENSLTPLLKDAIDLTGEDKDEQFIKDRNMAKAVLLQARWMHESDRFEANNIVAKFTQAIQLAQDLESPYYHLGRYYDTLQGLPDEKASYNFHTCQNYVEALKHGVKYIYRTMPRTLTIWLDLGDAVREKEKKSSTSIVNRKSVEITNLMTKARRELPTYEFLTAFPQIASRLGQKTESIQIVLIAIMAKVLRAYPLQALWPMVYLMQSNRPERKKLCTAVTHQTQQRSPHLTALIKDAERFSAHLLRLCNDTVVDKKKQCSIASHYPYMKHALPTQMMVPLQDALTGSLPSSAENLQTHNPFPITPVGILAFEDRIDIMQSLQKPKKVVFTSTDGKRYPFLCKPNDDLRKDARLMDFNSMINKLLKSASESRRRQLYIRTYAVMPLNEECGLLEWVANTNAFKNILEEGYSRYGKRLYTSELANTVEASRKQGSERQIEVFVSTILPMFSPTVFGDWFLMSWPEPSAWLSSRMAYCRTLAVMSMIGHVLGLGDRHGENILFDGLTGDTVHVDLNCLFEKAESFVIPERVPFRLTQNMVDAMGVTGTEGVFRKAAEITMEVLRSNSESLMSVLEAFVHDPLGEWTKGHKSKTEKEIRAAADKNLKPIQRKLKGMSTDGQATTVANQVERLIQDATAAKNLGLMYQGWTPWL